MKHLTTYKIFESNNIEETIKQDIKEICLELTDDEKFEIDIYKYQKLGGPKNTWVINIIRTPRNVNGGDYQGFAGGVVEFHFNEVKEYILRIKDYLGDKFKDFLVYSSNMFEWKLVKIDEDTNIDGLLGGVTISYKVEDR